MDRNLIQQVEENEEDIMGVPVCGGNLSSPVFNAASFIGEVHYKIGTRLYIEKCRLEIIRNRQEEKRDPELKNI